MKTTHSFRNLEEVLKSDKAGCYHCLRVFNVKDELAGRDPEDYCLSWDPIDDKMEPTVFCPFCEMDSVVGDASGLPIEDPAFLESMRKRWFETVDDKNAQAPSVESK